MQLPVFVSGRPSGLLKYIRDALESIFTADTYHFWDSTANGPSGFQAVFITDTGINYLNSEECSVNVSFVMQW